MDNINALETLRQMCCMAYFKNDNDCGSDYDSVSCADSGCKHFKFCQANSIVDMLLSNMEKEENKPE